MDHILIKDDQLPMSSQQNGDMHSIFQLDLDNSYSLQNCLRLSHVVSYKLNHAAIQRFTQITDARP